MPKTRSRINIVGSAAAVGAGLASALLAMMPVLRGADGGLASVVDMTSGDAMAWCMALIAPLPIMLASFAFGSIAGLAAAIVGAVAVGIVDLAPGLVEALHLGKVATGGIDTFLFALGIGMPSWLLASLAVLPAAMRRVPGKVPLRPEERRLGLVVAVAAGFAAIGVLLAIALAADARGSLHGFLEATAGAIEPRLPRVGALPHGLDPHRIALAFVWMFMAMLAAMNLLLMVVNLWLAARITQMSGLLAGPWPDIPSGLRLPRPLAIVLAVALGLSFAGGQLGAIGVILSGALGMAFAFQGLAVIHALTRGKAGMRLPLLIIVYLVLVILPAWCIAVYGLLGLIDSAVSFRDRQKPIVKKTN